MRPILTAVALCLSLTSAAHAADDYIDRYCALLASYAEGQMEIRQLGGSLADALADIDSSTDEYGHYREIVLDAWSRPRWPTPASRRRAIETFRDDWHLKCLRDAEP